MEIIEIHGKNPKILDVNIVQILEQISNPSAIFWDIIWLDGMGLDILSLEGKIKGSERGYLLSWTELQSLLESISSLNEIVLIGNEERKLLKKYKSDTTMRMTCDYCIELFDSSYWIVTSKSEEFNKRIVNSFNGVKISKIPTN